MKSARIHLLERMFVHPRFQRSSVPVFSLAAQGISNRYSLRGEASKRLGVEAPQVTVRRYNLSDYIDGSARFIVYIFFYYLQCSKKQCGNIQPEFTLAKRP